MPETNPIDAAMGEYRVAVEDSVAGFLRWRPDGRLLEVNPALARMFGYDSPEEMMSKVLDVGAQLCSSRGQYEDFISHLVERGRAQGFELSVVKADASVFWLGAYARSVEDARGERLFFEGSMFDITKQRLAEEESRQLSNQLRALTARLHDVREEERTHIARELHDELGKDLTLLTLDLAWLRERLLRIAPDDAQRPLAEKVTTMERTIQMTLQTVRRILSALRPPLLDELGLKDAIEFQVQEFAKRLGIRYELNATAVTVPSEKMGIAVFRIFQEILTNVARHAKASRIKVDLVESSSVLLLIVEDNGCGIAREDVAHSSGFGILGIRERALSIGGEIEIHRKASSGTRVLLRVPRATGTMGEPAQQMPDSDTPTDAFMFTQMDTFVTKVPQTEFPFDERILGPR
jgi:PAS domain S-box-containing protein